MVAVEMRSQVRDTDVTRWRTLLALEFTAPPTARYGAGRLIAGLSVAAALIALAPRIVVTVDWRPPSEAETPELT
ncbi:MAG: hypothetical protein H0U21_01915 [Acidimicrobiia bacterium]|nr:hypothetical protein [Acidimicrobiia bacterium]